MLNRTQRIASVLAVLFLISACATMKTPPEPPEVRSQKRWDALLVDDHAAAYSYLSPGYRSTVSIDDFRLAMMARTIRWAGATVVRTRDCEELRCVVIVKVDYIARTRLPGVGSYAMSQGAEENWINMDGVWYFVPNAIR